MKINCKQFVFALSLSFCASTLASADSLRGFTYNISFSSLSVCESKSSSILARFREATQFAITRGACQVQADDHSPGGGSENTMATLVIEYRAEAPANFNSTVVGGIDYLAHVTTLVGAASAQAPIGVYGDAVSCEADIAKLQNQVETQTQRSAIATYCASDWINGHGFVMVMDFNEGSLSELFSAKPFMGIAAEADLQSVVAKIISPRIPGEIFIRDQSLFFVDTKREVWDYTSVHVSLSGSGLASFLDYDLCINEKSRLEKTTGLVKEVVFACTQDFKGDRVWGLELVRPQKSLYIEQDQRQYPTLAFCDQQRPPVESEEKARDSKTLATFCAFDGFNYEVNFIKTWPK
jgi:hypothetical protein